MNIERSSCPSDVLGWIPWYPDGLEEAQRGAVESHAAECRDCRDEIASLQGRAEPTGPAPDPERIYAQVLARMEASPSDVEPPAESGSATRTTLPARPLPSGWRRIEPRRAMALAAGLLLALAIGAAGSQWLTGRTNEAPVYETASVSAGEPSNAVVLDVVFLEDASFSHISEALRAVDAQITSGPSQGRVYRLTLPAEADADAVALQLMGDHGVAMFAGKPLGGP